MQMFAQCTHRRQCGDRRSGNPSGLEKSVRNDVKHQLDISHQLQQHISVNSMLMEVYTNGTYRTRLASQHLS